MPSFQGVALRGDAVLIHRLAPLFYSRKRLVPRDDRTALRAQFVGASGEGVEPWSNIRLSSSVNQPGGGGAFASSGGSAGITHVTCRLLGTQPHSASDRTIAKIGNLSLVSIDHLFRNCRLSRL